MSIRERWREWREARTEYTSAIEEMQFHIEQETAHNIGLGMSPEEARRAATKDFGGVDRFAEAARDERSGTKLSDFAMSYLDWKLGARMLLRYPGISVIGGLTLTAAIGLGAGWFEMSMLTMYPELPLEDGDRIVRIENWDAAAAEPEPRSMHDFLAWREQLTSIEQLGAYRTFERNLITDEGEAQPVVIAEISTAVFPLTRVPPLLGRRLTEADEQQGAADVVVIDYDIWQRHFNGARDVIGRDVQLGGGTAAIVGVMPDGFAFPRHHQVWMPLRVTRVAPREGAEIGVFGRLAEGATLESAQAELTAVGARAAAENPATHAQLRPQVLPFAAPSGWGAARELLLINLFAWLLLAAASMNVATLMFARTAMRESEIVVRNALGASRARVMGQLFTEALVLTTVAAILGLAATSVVTGYLFRDYELRQVAMPFWYESDIEPVTILYTAVLAVAGAAVVGLLPAIRATGRHVQTSLSRIAAGGTSMGFGSVWSVIIVLQVAFSVICLPFGIAAVADLLRQRELRAAFPSDAFLTFRPELGEDRVAGAAADSTGAESAARMNQVIAELTRRLEREPGVVRVTAAAALPGTYHPLRTIEAQRGDEPPSIIDANTEGRRVRIGWVGVGYFEAFRLPVVAGRVFRHDDIDSPHDVVVINESMARNIGGNPVGVRVRFAAGADGAPGPWMEVVGVVGNLGLTPTGRGEADYMYLPVAPADAGLVAVHLNGDAASLAPRLRAIAIEIDPALRIYDLLTLSEVMRRYDRPTVHATLGGVGVLLLAIVLSAASLYALMSVAVARRTREIGIRMAVGAGPGEVLYSLFARAAAQVGLGIVIGNALVVLLLSMMVADLRAAQIVPAMLIASGVMAIVGFAACLVPGRRALRVQPTMALKEAR